MRSTAHLELIDHITNLFFGGLLLSAGPVVVVGLILTL